MYKGIPQNDVGIRTDVLENIPKHIGMKMLIRSMAPDIICADEIGKEEDIDAIKNIICSGVKGIFTAHANGLDDLRSNNINTIINVFDKVILMDKENRGNIKEIYNLKS